MTGNRVNQRHMMPVVGQPTSMDPGTSPDIGHSQARCRQIAANDLLGSRKLDLDRNALTTGSFVIKLDNFRPVIHAPSVERER